MSGIDVDAVDGVVRIRVRVGEKTATLRVMRGADWSGES